MKQTKFIFCIILFVSPIFNIIIEDKERENTIYLVSKVNEIFALTEISQYFTNPLNSTIELSVTFPIIKDISLTRFIISVGDKIISSKIMPKEQAEDKYKDTVYKGNLGFISEYEKDNDNYLINIGNINPNQTVILNTFFTQNIGSQDMSYEFIIMEKYPTFHYKELNKNELRNKKINANFIIESQSKITRLIAPFYDEEAKKNSIFNISFSNDYKKAYIKYIKNPDNQKNFEIKKNGEETGYSGEVNKPTFLITFSILFRTENMNKPKLYYQYNPLLNETSYSINYVYSSEQLKKIPIPNEPDLDNKISYYSKYEEKMINENPGLFIFLLDQSGSMSGDPIKLVKNALLLFIKSLPPGSYFQFIGFGTDFIKYNTNPVEYNKKNVDNIIKIIKNMDADMGGTNMGPPLKDIYNNKNYEKINLSKNIFILTDGQVFDRDEIVGLITANAYKFRIHALGIGYDFDKIFIERSGKLGRGSSFFVEDIEKINSAVIGALSKSLEPYIIDIKINFNNYKKNIENSIIKCNPLNEFSYQDDIINFSFILNNKYKIDIDNLSEPFNIEIIGNKNNNLIKDNIYFYQNKNIIKLPDGDEMSKMIVGKALKNNKELIDDQKKEVEFSIKYQILSKNTAYFSELLNDKNNSKYTELININLNNYYYFNEDLFDYSARLRDSNIRTLGSINRDVDTFSFTSRRKLNCEEKDIDFSGLKMPIEEEIEYKVIENNTFDKKDQINLIMTQDIIEGFWSENEETKKLINIIGQEIFNKICDKVKLLYKGKKDNNIKYTILVIYYLTAYHSDKLDEYKLIINKAKKFLSNEGIEYENFIEGI